MHLTDRYTTAVHYALAVHGAHVRKGTRIPYAAHLMGVSALVLGAGGDEELAIAALLHDAAEDHGGERRLADIRQRFGERIAGIVRECSDSLDADDAARDWITRKREHLDRLQAAGDDTLVVWTADKVDNCRALGTDLQVRGPSVLESAQRSPAQALWYYRANLSLSERRSVRPELVVPLGTAVAQLAGLLAGYQDVAGDGPDSRVTR